MAEAPESCLVCGYTDSSTSIDTASDQSTYQSTFQGTDQSTYQGNDQSTDQGTDQSTYQGNDQSTYQGTDQSTYQDNDQSTYQGTDQSTDQSTYQGTDQSTYPGANSSTNHCASERKMLYPKIHFCGKIIWICSTCPIKGRQCEHCKEDLLDSQVDTKENLRHTQLFTDLTMAEERENIKIFQNENIFCKNHTDVIAVSFCPQCECKFLCQDCSKQHCEENKYHIVKHIGRIKECKQNKNSSPCVVHTDTNSDFFCCTHNVPVCLDCKYLYHKTCTVKRFTESLDETKRKLKDFIEKLESKEGEIYEKLTEEFNQLSLGTDRELKKSVEDEYNKKKSRISGHIPLIRRVLESPPEAAFFDMTQTLAVIVNSIEKDISEMNDVNVQTKSQERREDFKEVKAMKVVSRRSSHGMETKNTLYNSARSVSGPKGSINITEPGMSHETKNVVYVYTCTICHMLYVGQTIQTLKGRDDGHRSKGSIYDHEQEHECANEKGKKELKHFVVTCVRKDLEDEDQRLMMERLIILKLGTLKPHGINERLPYEIDTSLEILRFQTWNGAVVELRNDGHTAIIKESNGINSLVLSREVLIFKNSYEVLLEEITNEQATIGVFLENRGENPYELIPIKLPTCTMPCRLGIDFYKQYGYVYVNGIRVNSITLQENFKYWAVFQACSKITGLPIQPQKTWKFAEDAWLTLSDESRTAECRSLGHITSEVPMKVNTLYEIIVDELYDNHNGLSDLGIWIKTASTAPWIAQRIELIKGIRYGVIVDAQKHLHLILNGEYKGIIGKCETLPSYFFLWCKGLKVSTLPETTVFFDQEGKIIP